VGYDVPARKIVYRNPSLRDGAECEMSFECFEEARNYYGTDDDVIFVYNKSSSTTASQTDLS
jgi:hypothetical protein